MDNDELDGLIERVEELQRRLQATPGGRLSASARRELDASGISETMQEVRRLLDESRAILESLHAR